MPDTKVLWSPRVAMNWDVNGNQTTQVRGGTGLFSGRPAYVWISNQVGNTGVLIGERIADNTTAFPFNPNADATSRRRSTGGGASSYALNVTDAGFKFPQVWRSNIALDRKLFWGITSTTEYIYSKDVNGIYYINANLPAAQSAFNGADRRPRWVGTPCASAGQVGGCVTRLNNDPGNQVTVNYVLKNESEGNAWNFAQSLSKNTHYGLSVRGAYSYGVSKSLSDPESTAATSFSRASHYGDPNNPGLADSLWSPGHRVYALVNFSRDYFSFGSTVDLRVLGSAPQHDQQLVANQLCLCRRHEWRSGRGQRPDLHPARHVRDELRGRSPCRAAPSRLPSRPPLSRPSSSRTIT